MILIIHTMMMILMDSIVCLTIIVSMIMINYMITIVILVVSMDSRALFWIDMGCYIGSSIL